jgi:L-ascorbate metabolism protein UlaG (beta-lactamase superfamily)
VKKLLPYALALTVIGLGVLGRQLFLHPSMKHYSSLYLSSSSSRTAIESRFFGATTILLEDGKTSIMIDGFFSRPSAARVIFGRLASEPDQIRDELRRLGIGSLDAVLVAHSHYDHALDAPVVAAATGALLIGSESTANIGRGYDLAVARTHTVRDREILYFGRFIIEVIKSPHSPNPRYLGFICKPLEVPASVNAFRSGENYSYLVRHESQRILVWPSANFTPNRLRGVSADVIFLGIGTLGKQSEKFAREYWHEVVQSTGAKLVIPIHWDNLTRPLVDGLQPIPYGIDNFDRSMKLLLKLAKEDGVVVRLMPINEPVKLPTTSHAGYIN